MEIGPYALPGLALLIVLTVAFVTIYWVFDGSEVEDDVEMERQPTRTQRGYYTKFRRK